MEFRHQETVRFGQVDAAGIVFYPRYFEMLSNTLEVWFAELGASWQMVHGEDRSGTPILETSAKFVKASRLGDELTFAMVVTDIGRATVDMKIVCTCAGELRMEATVRHIYVSLEPLKSKTWPDDLRAKMEAYLAS